MISAFSSWTINVSCLFFPQICKDKAEAEVWIAGLKSLISSGQGGRSKIDGWSDGGLYLDVILATLKLLYFHIILSLSFCVGPSEEANCLIFTYNCYLRSQSGVRFFYRIGCCCNLTMISCVHACGWDNILFE